jgi:hypothetical protein
LFDAFQPHPEKAIRISRIQKGRGSRRKEIAAADR